MARPAPAPATSLYLAGLGILALCHGLHAAQEPEQSPPDFPREFRAVWVATVANIDWPSRPGLPSDQQKQEALAILDRALELRLNAVVLQIRTAADALYSSSLEPWSAVLSGKQGQPPAPLYDPLEFWLAEAHKRGLLLHAWFNPFRALPSGSPEQLAPEHVANSHPAWVKQYGNMMWMDPGEIQARQHTLAVVEDVIKRYDIDGIHIDDYFYPYPVADPDHPGQELPFPDDPSWQAYQQEGGKLERNDWRRQNINLLVEEMHKLARTQKPEVLFGVSPFGIPRPGKPPGVVGFDQYDKLYADSETWLLQGWCDYWTPQLYWRIDSPGQPFRELLKYWAHINAHGRHLWPGLSISRVGPPPKGYPVTEISEQISVTRSIVRNPGNVLFSMKALMRDNEKLAEHLAGTVYDQPALVPATPWRDTQPPAPPTVKTVTENKRPSLTLNPGPGEAPFLWAVWTRQENAWNFQVLPAASSSLSLPSANVDRVAVAAVDRLGNTSALVLTNITTQSPRPASSSPD